jgi:hypothetical protein
VDGNVPGGQSGNSREEAKGTWPRTVEFQVALSNPVQIPGKTSTRKVSSIRGQGKDHMHKRDGKQKCHNAQGRGGGEVVDKSGKRPALKSKGSEWTELSKGLPAWPSKPRSPQEGAWGKPLSS